MVANDLPGQTAGRRKRNDASKQSHLEKDKQSESAISRYTAQTGALVQQLRIQMDLKWQGLEHQVPVESCYITLPI